MSYPSPTHPVVPRFGIAVANLQGGTVVAANPLWHSLGVLQDVPQLVKPRGRGGAPVFVPLLFDGHRLPVWTALAAPAHSRHWPELAGLAAADPASINALAFVPSRVAAFPALAARTFRLAEAERETLALLLISHDISELADRLGLSRAGARRRAEALYRAIGVHSLSGLQAQTTRLLTDEFVSDHQYELGLQAVLTLSPAQASVTRLVGAGFAVPDIAARLGLSSHTVRDHARAALDKALVPRLKDLAQIANEAAAVHAIANGSDGLHHDRGDLLDATLILHRGGRQIGVADFGPQTGVPVLVCHGGMATRGLGSHLRTALQRQGFRPIGIDRPGFGLSDPADGNPQFETAADDMAFVAAELGIGPALLFANDGGVASALAFWQRHGDRAAAGVLISPRPPAGPRAGSRMVDRFARAALQRPEAINGLWKLIRQRAGSALAARLSERLFAGHPVDAALLANPDFRNGLIAELLTCGIRSGLGISAEQSEYRHWQPRPGGPALPWAIILAEHDPLWAPSLKTADSRRVWDVLGDPAWHVLPGAGRFAISSHADAIAAIAAQHWQAVRGAG